MCLVCGCSCLCADCRVGLSRLLFHAEISATTRSHRLTLISSIASPRLYSCKFADHSCEFPSVLSCGAEVALQPHGQRAGTVQIAPCLQVVGDTRGGPGGLECMLCVLFSSCNNCCCVCLEGEDRRGRGDGVWRCGHGVDWA